MFIFSLCVGITALVLGGVAISRTNTSAPIVPSVTNNFPAAPAPPGAPALPSAPAPASEPLVRNSNSGSQTALYFLTVYQNDATCTKATSVYDPTVDPLSIGLFSNPIMMDRTQSQCFPITYRSSFGVVAGSNKYLSFRRFSSANCSGPFQDTVRLLLGCTAMPDVATSALLFYKVTVVRPETYALNYPTALGGHESFDYHAAQGKFFLGNLFNQEITAFDPTLNAVAARPNIAGGKGYPGVETYVLGMGTFFTSTLPGISTTARDSLRNQGLNVAGVKCDFAQGPFGPYGSPRNRVWATRIQFFGDQSTSIYGGASVIDFSQTPPAQVSSPSCFRCLPAPPNNFLYFFQFHFDMNPITYPAGANQDNVSGVEYVRISNSSATSLPAGMLINDIAIDPDNGDAYFTDSFNCRKTSDILCLKSHC